MLALVSKMTGMMTGRVLISVGVSRCMQPIIRMPQQQLSADRASISCRCCLCWQ